MSINNKIYIVTTHNALLQTYSVHAYLNSDYAQTHADLAGREHLRLLQHHREPPWLSKNYYDAHCSAYQHEYTVVDCEIHTELPDVPDTDYGGNYE